MGNIYNFARNQQKPGSEEHSIGGADENVMLVGYSKKTNLTTASRAKYQHLCSFKRPLLTEYGFINASWWAETKPRQIEGDKAIWKEYWYRDTKTHNTVSPRYRPEPNQQNWTETADIKTFFFIMKMTTLTKMHILKCTNCVAYKEKKKNSPSKAVLSFCFFSSMERSLSSCAFLYRYSLLSRTSRRSCNTACDTRAL